MPAPVIPRDDDAGSPILRLDSFPSTGTPLHSKKSGYDFFASIGSPKHVVAPMVDQSELAWRILSRRYDSHLVYTPMINARAFANRVKSQGKLKQPIFWLSPDANKQEEGAASIVKDEIDLGTDRPVIAQFAAHDPEVLLYATQAIEEHCNAVDLNLGCPQDIARRGHYGSFLQSDWQLIFKLINTLHLNLKIPVTAKMRVFESTERTVAYALMMERAGAQIITVHGRTREMKGHKTGLADWEKIKAVKEAVKVPVLANGNVLFREDVEKALEMTGCDGVMSAEGNLYNPTIFSKPPSEANDLYPLAPTYPFPRLLRLIAEYLDICDHLDTPTASSAIKSHIFRLAKPALEVHRDLRPVLGESRVVEGEVGRKRYEAYHAFLEQLSERLDKDEKNEKYTSQLSKIAVEFEAREGEDPIYIPHWLAQPYYRKTLPPSDEGEDEKKARRGKRAERVEQTEGLVAIDDIQTKSDAVTMQEDKENVEEKFRVR
jgi:tRNA-dihydrouridine synthase 1